MISSTHWLEVMEGLQIFKAPYVESKLILLFHGQLSNLSLFTIGNGLNIP
jgi:hypothetical protein